MARAAPDQHFAKPDQLAILRAAGLPVPRTLVTNDLDLLRRFVADVGGRAVRKPGEQQMLAIGRALMTRPSILLLDEPSLGLSPRLTRRPRRPGERAWPPSPPA